MHGKFLQIHSLLVIAGHELVQLYERALWASGLCGLVCIFAFGQDVLPQSDLRTYIGTIEHLRRSILRVPITEWCLKGRGRRQLQKVVVGIPGRPGYSVNVDLTKLG
jgi:hypothetical protein